jgi:hypothetical protein
MVSPFLAIDAAASAAVDTAFGEKVRILPRLGGKYSAGGADHDRSERDVIAVLTEDHDVQRTDGDRIGKNFGFNLEAGPIRVSFDNGLFPALSDRPNKGDQLQARDRPGQPIFEVVRVLPDNASRIVLHCSRLKAP